MYEREYRSVFRDIDRWLWFTSHRTKLLDKWQVRLAAWLYSGEQILHFFANHIRVPTYIFNPTNKNSRFALLWRIFSLTWQKSFTTRKAGEKGTIAPNKRENPVSRKIDNSARKNAICNLVACVNWIVWDWPIWITVESSSIISRHVFPRSSVTVLYSLPRFYLNTRLPLHRHIRKPLYFLPSYLVTVWQNNVCIFGLYLLLPAGHLQNFCVIS